MLSSQFFSKNFYENGKKKLFWLSSFFIQLPSDQTKIHAALRSAAIEKSLKNSEINRCDVTKDTPIIFSSPIVSVWPKNTSIIFDTIWSNFSFISNSKSQDEIVQKFEQTAGKLQKFGFSVKSKHGVKFGSHATMQVAGKTEQCPLHLLSLIGTEPAKSSARITEVAGPYVRPSRAHFTWRNPIYQEK